MVVGIYLKYFRYPKWDNEMVIPKITQVHTYLSRQDLFALFIMQFTFKL